jgi:hypothetical protein
MAPTLYAHPFSSCQKVLIGPCENDTPFSFRMLACGDAWRQRTQAALVPEAHAHPKPHPPRPHDVSFPAMSGDRGGFAAMQAIKAGRLEAAPEAASASERGEIT